MSRVSDLIFFDFLGLDFCTTLGSGRAGRSPLVFWANALPPIAKSNSKHANLNIALKPKPIKYQMRDYLNFKQAKLVKYCKHDS